MRIATPHELTQIDPPYNAPIPSAVLSTLGSHQGVWHHIPRNEVQGPKLSDQIDGLIAEGTDLGLDVRTRVIEGHPERGFFAVAYVDMTPESVARLYRRPTIRWS